MIAPKDIVIGVVMGTGFVGTIVACGLVLGLLLAAVGGIG